MNDYNKKILFQKVYNKVYVYKRLLKFFILK